MGDNRPTVKRSCELCRRPQAVPERDPDRHLGTVTLDNATHQWLCNACWFGIRPPEGTAPNNRLKP